MPLKARSTLKIIFGVLGARPGVQDFIDWLDSFVHKDELAEVNAATINRKLTAYDLGLKAESNATFTATLGDILKSFTGWERGKKLIDVLNSVAPDWAKITNKPSTVLVRWNEQIVSVDPSTGFDGRQGAASTSNLFVTKWLLSEVAARSTGTMVILDMQVCRRFTGVTSETNPTAQPYMVTDSLTKIKIGVNPSVNLTA